MTIFKPPAVIVDMDGTLVDVHPIRHLVMNETKNFDKFHTEAVNCKPIQWVLDDVKQHYNQGLKILIVTARSDKHERSTSFWLAMHKVPHHELFMRREGDYREDRLVKKDILTQVRQAYTPVLAIDDNPRVLRLWKKEGISTVVVPGWID